MDIEWLESCNSTNTVLAAKPDAAHGTVAATRAQTAGRGQRGNSWESEPGANLTFSIVMRPAAIEAARQFELSMIVSLAIIDVLNEVFEEHDTDSRAQIKWPNDIYVGNRKICGILIENSLAGNRIERSIAGIGINVNQKEFLSDAPNPVSMCHITGRTDESLERLLDRICSRILADLEAYEERPDPSALNTRYMARLWRRTGSWTFRRPDGSTFEASIVSVAPDGMLSLSDGRSYAFKEIAFVL